MSKVKYGIVGIGPVGGILAAHLIRRGNDVSLVDPFSVHMDRLGEEGIQITGAMDLVVPVPEEKLFLKLSEVAPGPLDVIFFCMKAGYLNEVIPMLKGVSDGNTTLVSFQNGIDTERRLADALGPERVLRGVVNYAGNLVEPGLFNMTFFNPPNFLGALTPGMEGRARELSEIMTQCGLATSFTDEIQKHVWEKAILNACMAPITALTRMNMKQAMEFPQTNEMMRTLLRECIDVARGMGIEYGDDFFATCISYLSKAGPHTPSMLIDVEDHRRTEISFLNQSIMAYGQRYGIPTPCNDIITNLVLGLDHANMIKRKE